MVSFDAKESTVVEDCILFAYSHSQITEGRASSFLRVNRIDFRDRWIAYLRKNPEVAIATGWDLHVSNQVANF